MQLQKKGWMEAEVFENYFKKTLIANIGSERPIILFYDGN